MLASAIPLRFVLAFAKNAAGAYIRTVPVASQIGLQDGAASFNDGFVPDNFTSLAAGGVPPFGQDFNGVLNITTTWDQWYQAGAPIGYDATFAAAIGGYPLGAILNSSVVAGAQWYSLVENNLTNPDDLLTSVNWARVGVQVGTLTPFLTTVIPAGYIPANGGALGNAASGSNYADDSYVFLFNSIWSNFSNTQCPIFTSGGVPTSRGANGAADFLANKRLIMPNTKGLSTIGVDTMGLAPSTFLSGIPVTIGNTTTPGSIYGENLHQLSTAELASHTHVNTVTNNPHTHGVTGGVLGGTSVLGAQAGGGGNVPQGAAGGNSIVISSATQSTTISNAAAGGDGSHNTVHRTMGVYWGQKT